MLLNVLKGLHGIMFEDTDSVTHSAQVQVKNISMRNSEMEQFNFAFTVTTQNVG